MIVGNVNTFGGIIKRPLEFDVGRIGVDNAFDLRLLLLCHTVNALLVRGTGGRVCVTRNWERKFLCYLVCYIYI